MINNLVDLERLLAKSSKQRGRSKSTYFQVHGGYIFAGEADLSELNKVRASIFPPDVPAGSSGGQPRPRATAGRGAGRGPSRARAGPNFGPARGGWLPGALAWGQ